MRRKEEIYLQVGKEREEGKGIVQSMREDFVRKNLERKKRGYSRKKERRKKKGKQTNRHPNEGFHLA